MIRTSGRPARDLRGLRFGMLTPFEYLGNGLWLCRCDCGGVTKAGSNRLTLDRPDRITSCGCVRFCKATERHPLARRTVLLRIARNYLAMQEGLSSFIQEIDRELASS